MAVPWRIELLGHLRASRGERVITRFRTQKTAALLAYLAYYAHRPHPRGELVELFWPDGDPEDGRHSLSQALSSLRSLLEPRDTPAGTVIVADRAWVQLNPQAITTDVAEFHAALRAARAAGGDATRIAHLTTAVEQFGGELLPGYLEEWVLLERPRLHEALFRAVEALIAHHEAAGDLETALALARRALSVDPLREESHREVIRLLSALGRPDAALRQYRELERLLREGLETAPSDDVRSFVRDRRSPRFLAPDASAASDSLPVYLTRFFGREDEIARLCALFLGESEGATPHAGDTDTRQATREPARLVTLTGPGGSGKTRLAVEAARRLLPAWSGEVWFVPLADLLEAERSADVIRDALRLPRSPQAEPIEQVMAALARRPTLLVLDNFERLVEGAAPIVRHLLERVPGLTCMVTSRRRLGLTGEQEFLVLPLPVPEAPSAQLQVPGCRRHVEGGRPPEGSMARHDYPNLEPGAWSLERLTAFPSVQLLADRARAVSPNFAVRPENAAAVAALCRRLEGVPLAIELAAARAAVLTPEQMIARLEGAAHASPVLTRALGEAHERHQSLRATLEWSYHLLSPELQRFFARLSVFRGGWTQEAAEAVCDEPLALDYLSRLKDCSLVQSESVGKAVRFRVLETVREFVAEQLAPAERADVERRHIEYYLVLAERAAPELQGADQARWLDILEGDHENLRAALDRSVEVLPSHAVRLGVALWRFWQVRGHLAEGRQRLAKLLALPEAAAPTAMRARLLDAAGILASDQCDYAKASSCLAQSLEIWTALGDHSGMAFSTFSLADVAQYQSCHQQARDLYEASLGLYRVVGDRRGIALSLGNLGQMARVPGQTARARGLLEESVALLRELDDAESLGYALIRLGALAWQQTDCVTAHLVFHESLTIFRKLESPEGIGTSLLGLGYVAAAEGRLPAARSLLEESYELERTIGNKRRMAEAAAKLGRVALRQGNPDFARSFLENAHRLAEEIGDEWRMTLALQGLAELALQQGDPWAARVLSERNLRMRRELRVDHQVLDALTLCAELAEAGGVEGLSSIASQRRRRQHAVALRGAISAAGETLGLPPASPELHQRDPGLSALRNALGEAMFTAAWEAGRALSWEEAVAYALGEIDLPASAAGSGSDAFPKLTDAQWAAIRSVLPTRPTGGRPRVDDRRALSGILYLLWTGCRWRHLPREYGSPATCWRRLNEWRASDMWDRIRNAFLATLDDPVRSEWESLFATRSALATDARPARASRPATSQRKPS